MCTWVPVRVVLLLTWLSGIYGDGKTLQVDISRMATRYHDLEISGEFASCHLLGTGRIVSPSYTNAMKGSCKVFPWMEILAAFVLALYGLSSWSSSKKLNLRASFWLEWENKTTFGKTFTWNIFWCFTRISEQTFGRKIRVDGNKSKVIFAKAKYLSDAKHAFKVCSKACRVIRF